MKGEFFSPLDSPGAFFAKRFFLGFRQVVFEIESFFLSCGYLTNDAPGPQIGSSESTGLRRNEAGHKLMKKRFIFLDGKGVATITASC